MSFKGAVVITGISATFAACSSEAPPTTATPISSTTACRRIEFNVPASTLTIGAEGGATSVSFNGIPNGGSSCTGLVPVSNASFITVGVVSTAGRGGTYGYIAALVVAPNLSATSRTGTVTFNDATLIVKQERNQIGIALFVL